MKNYKLDFPIFKSEIKGNPLVYLDSAATSQKPKTVIESISKFYENNNSNVKRGIYPLAEKATELVEQVRGKTARFINAKSKQEIIFVRNATEAINLLAHSISYNNKPFEVITTTIVEHHSNFVPWQVFSAKTNSLFEILDITENFKIKFSNFKKIRILAITHVSNVLGEILDIAEIVKEAKRQNPEIIVIVDAAGSVAHIPIDVQKMGCDFLVFSGHKMFAGMGVGVLYGKREKLIELDPFLYGGQMIEEVSLEKTTFRGIPDKFEAGTMSAADIVSLGAAIDYIKTVGFSNIIRHERELTEYAILKLSEIGGLRIIGPGYSENRLGVVSFVIDGIHPHDIAQLLGDMGICVRAGHHCAMPLHRRLKILASTRLSISIYNNKSDIDRFLKGLGIVRKTFLR